jgi:hypothetical protein
MSCGAPEVEAGALMSHNGNGHCYFVRQPITAEEVNAAILGLWTSCCGAVRYGGQDHGILVRLAEIGEADTCDFRLEIEPGRACISHLTFEFVDAESPTSGRLAARKIMKYFAEFLVERHGPSSRALDFLCSGATASFRFEWGRESLPIPCIVKFALEAANEKSWLLRIGREDHPNKPGDAIGIYKAIESDERFQQVQWFSEEEWKIGARDGRTCPF